MNEVGATTAEYAVGTLGAASVAAILIGAGMDSWWTELIKDLIAQALDPNGLLDHLELLPRPTWGWPW